MVCLHALPGLAARLLVLAVLLAGAAAVAAPAPNPAKRAVLVLDFTGANDSLARPHAEEFAKGVMPEIDVFTYGIHGVVRDERRKSAGFDGILTVGSDAQRVAAAGKVIAALKGHDRAIVGIDMNESWIPQQARGDLPRFAEIVLPPPVVAVLRLLPDKTEGPGRAAARVAVEWKRLHPDGVIIIRGHSDGTWATLAAIGEMARLQVAPDAVVLESLRQDYALWDSMARFFTGTRFLELASRNDLWSQNLVQTRPSPTYLPNWTRAYVDLPLDPLKAHGVMTHTAVLLPLEVTSARGTSRFIGTIGDVETAFLSDLVVTAVPALRVSAQALAAPGTASTQRLVHAGAAVKGVPVATPAAKALRDMLVSWIKVYKEGEHSPMNGRAGAIAVIAADKLAKALGDDIQDGRRPLTVLSSHTVDAAADIVLGWIEDAEHFKHNGARKNLAIPVAWLAGVRGFVTVFGQVAAGAELDPERIAATYEAVKSLSSKGLVAHLEQALYAPGSALAKQDADRFMKGIKGRLLFLDALTPLIEAIAIRAKTGHWTIEAIDKVSDAVMIAAASVLVWEVADPDMAAAARDAIVSTARFLREGSAGAGLWIWLKNKVYGKEWGVADLYAQYQASCVRRGQVILDIDALYSPEDLRRMGLSAADIRRINAQTRLYNAHMAKNQVKKTELATVAPEKPKHEERTKLKPWPNNASLYPPGDGFKLDGAGGGGPGRGGSARGRYDDDDRGPGGGGGALVGGGGRSGGGGAGGRIGDERVATEHSSSKDAGVGGARVDPNPTFIQIGPDASALPASTQGAKP